jgi:hypothetical protein
LAAYWLFVGAVLLTLGALTGAAEAGNREAAGAIVAAALVVAAIVFVTWVIRLLRHPSTPGSDEP